MKIAIVILNWNGRALLEQFLPSITTYSKGAVLYVADNASTDDSIAFLEAEYPTIKIITNTTNGGYAKGYNDALSQIDTDIFCLLNSDVAVTENWLQPIHDVFEQQSNVAAIQPKILDYKRPEYFEYAGAAGGYIDQFGYPYCRGRIFDSIEKDLSQYNDTTPIFWASGACLFIRKQVFDIVGQFDEDYFAHQEEIDLCWRIHNHGYQILYMGSSTVFHVGGATLNAASPQKTFLNFRNSLFNLIKNVPGYHVPYIIFCRMLLDGVAGIKFLTEGKTLHFFAILKAHGFFYLKFLKFLKKRSKSSKPSKKSNYFQRKSILWDYFILKNQIFQK